MLAAVHLIGAAVDLAGQIKTAIATPLLNAMKFLIPAVVAIAGLHKLAEHREGGVAVLLDILVKGGAAFAIITLIQSLFGM